MFELLEAGLEGMRAMLGRAGFTAAEIEAWIRIDRGGRTGLLADDFDPDLPDRPPEAELKAIHRLGDPARVADFLVAMLTDPPSTAPPLASRVEEDEALAGPRWRVATAAYQVDHDSLIEAFSIYQGRFFRGCAARVGDGADPDDRD